MFPKLSRNCRMPASGSVSVHLLQCLALRNRGAVSQIWMLTGDKAETAVNIAFATQMLTSEMELFMCTLDSLGHNSVHAARALVGHRAERIRNDNASHKGWALCPALASLAVAACGCAAETAATLRVCCCGVETSRACESVCGHV